LDSLSSVEQLAEQAKRFDFPAIGLTDHGGLGGMIKFYKACKAIDITPIIGCELYITEDADGLTKEEMTKDNYHLTTLAMNDAGLRNLMILNAEAYRDNFYYKPRVHERKLAEHSEGLVVLSSCLGGRLAGAEDESQARAIIEFYREVFGKNFFMEIMGLPTDNPVQAQEQMNLNAMALTLGNVYDIPAIITTDSHYSCQGDKELHEVLMCIGLKKTLPVYQEQTEMKIPTTCFIKGKEEMEESARNAGCEDAVANSLKVLDLYEGYNLKLGEPKMSEFDPQKQEDYQEFQESLNVQ